MQKKGKLELALVDKYESKVVKPRIPVKYKAKSYGDLNSKNMLIHRDNLITLHSLMQDYARQVKFYMNSPHSTGNILDPYDYNLEYSTRLTLMQVSPAQFDFNHKTWTCSFISDDNIKTWNFCKYILGTVLAVPKE